MTGARSTPVPATLATVATPVVPLNIDLALAVPRPETHRTILTRHPHPDARVVAGRFTIMTNRSNASCIEGSATGAGVGSGATTGVGSGRGPATILTLFVP